MDEKFLDVNCSKSFVSYCMANFVFPNQWRIRLDHTKNSDEFCEVNERLVVASSREIYTDSHVSIQQTAIRASSNGRNKSLL